MSANETEIRTHLVFELGENFFGAADVIASRALDYFSSIEPAVADGVRSRMREGNSPHEGPTEKESLMILTLGNASGEGSISLIAWSDVIQAAVDETGATFRNMPPWKEGTSLFAWVDARGLGGLLTSQRRALGQLLGRQGAADEAEASKKRTESITFAIALSIFRRGLPAPDDYLHAPFENTFLEFLPDVMANLEALGVEAAQTVNGLI